MWLVAQWIYSNLLELVIGFCWQGIWNGLHRFGNWIQAKIVGLSESLKKSYAGIIPIDQAEPAYVYTTSEQYIEFVDEQTIRCVPQDGDTEAGWNAFMQSDFILGLDGVSMEKLRQCFMNSVREVGTLKDNRKILAVRKVVCNRVGKDEKAWAKLYMYHTDTYTKELLNHLFRKLSEEYSEGWIVDIESFMKNSCFVYGFQINLTLLSSQGKLILKRQNGDQDGMYIRTMHEIYDVNVLELANLKSVIEKDCKKSGIVVAEIKLQNIYFDTEQMNVIIGAEVKTKNVSVDEGYELLAQDTKGLIRFLRKEIRVSNSCAYDLIMLMSRNCIKEAIRE